MFDLENSKNNEKMQAIQGVVAVNVQHIDAYV